MAKNKKLIWIELLRILACFGVIVLHMGSQHFRDIPVDSFSWMVSNFYHGITRFAVACFVMISGCLYLDEKRSWTPKKVMKTFLPIGVSFAFWQFFYAAFRILKAGQIEIFSVEAFKKICIMMTKSYFHLWYLPMLLGLVLITPFIWKIVNGDKGKQWSEFLLVLFFLFHIIPNTVNDFTFPYKEYIIKIMNLVKPDLITGYVGYFVLGHYLSKYNISRKIEAVIYTVSIFSAGYSIYLCQYYSLQSGKATQAFYENFTFAALFMSMGVFLLFKNHVSRIAWNEKAERIITVIGSHTFGIYLIHALIRELFNMSGINTLSFNTLAAIPAIAVAIFVISFIIAFILKKIPIIGKWIV